MSTTKHTGITLIEQAQAQKEVTANEAFSRIDALLNHGAIQAGLNTPPTSPLEGDVYILGNTPTGQWTGKALAIAYFDQIWRFIMPQSGSMLWVQSASRLFVFEEGAWHPTTAMSGEHCVSISADRIFPAVNNGCAGIARFAIASDQPDCISLDFDATTSEYALFGITPPSSWNGQAFTAQMVWSHANATGSFGVVWSVQTVFRSDAEAIATAYGTPAVVTDTGGVANTVYISPKTPVITPAGTVSANGILFVRVARVASHTNDTLSVDGRLHEIRLFFSI